MIFSLIGRQQWHGQCMTVMCLGPVSTVCLVCRMIPNIIRKCTQTTIQYELLCPIFKKPLTKFLSDLSLSPIKVIIVVATCYFLCCNVTLQNTNTTVPQLKILKFKLFVFPNTTFFIIYPGVVIMAGQVVMWWQVQHANVSSVCVLYISTQIVVFW